MSTQQSHHPTGHKGGVSIISKTHHLEHNYSKQGHGHGHDAPQRLSDDQVKSQKYSHFQHDQVRQSFQDGSNIHQLHQLQGQSQTNQLNPQADNYSNPRIAFFHVIFKVLAVVFYLFCGWVTNSFVLQFVIIVLLVAIDFWTVKNVSGRKLVGLRYWNENDEQGHSIWHFESLDKQSLDQLNKRDTWLFWTSLYITPAIWMVFGLVAIVKFSFDYLILVIIAIILCITNIIGFTKCRKDAKKRVQSFAQQAMGGMMQEAMTGGIISKVLNVF